ncbi:ROK family transcriptional regulator [Nocardioides aurantiacus]|uniref:ROK family transcriptional regulator n=1 Tax=Nocardioides aurantiacus TaxID=86796 RepID=UPI001FEA9883|nr:ROK family transcriptional regulator [Nocardioides aurantiacus]
MTLSAIGNAGGPRGARGGHAGVVVVPGDTATAGEVFSLVRDGVVATRSDIARLTGLSRTAVAARVQALIDVGLVAEGTDPDRPPASGRPPVVLRLDRAAGVVLAAAIGRSRTQLGVCDLDGQVLLARDVDQEVGLTPDVLMPRVVAALGELLGELGRDAAEVRAVGLSIPGTVDTATGASLDSPIMTGWDGVALAPYVAELAGAPVFVDNDANVMALSERRGHLEAHRDLLFLKASTGIGVGVVTGGRLVRGGLGAGGEIGHTKVPAATGMACRCGESGCLESLASGWALVQAAREAGHEVSHVRDLVALAGRGDPEARHLVREAGRRIGEVLAAAVNLLNPEAVVVGGDLAGAYDPFVAGLRESLYSLATALATRDLVIVALTHGERSGVVGCAALALREVLDSTAVDRLLAARGA